MIATKEQIEEIKKINEISQKILSAFRNADTMSNADLEDVVEAQVKIAVDYESKTKNPNTKEQLIAIIERMQEEIETYFQGGGSKELLNDEMEKLEYEFKNGSD